MNCPRCGEATCEAVEENYKDFWRASELFDTKLHVTEFIRELDCRDRQIAKLLLRVEALEKRPLPSAPRYVPPPKYGPSGMRVPSPLDQLVQDGEMLRELRKTLKDKP